MRFKNRDRDWKRRSVRRGTKRGSTLVEFALLLPLLMIVTLGLVQYGVLMNTTSTLTSIAREGARYGALNALSGTDAEVQAAVKRYMQRVAAQTGVRDMEFGAAPTPQPNQTPQPRAQVTITTPEGRRSGKPLRVEVSYPLSRKLFLPATFFGIPILGTQIQNYSARTEMIIQEKSTAAPNASATPLPTPTNTPRPPTPTPTSTNTPGPTATATNTATPVPTPTNTPYGYVPATPTPRPSATATNTAGPTNTPITPPPPPTPTPTDRPS